MKKFKLPKVGWRNLKTALSVFLCVFLFEIMGRPLPFYACIAAVICTRDTWESSFNMGKSRMIGTIIGGLMGVTFIFIARNLPFVLSYSDSIFIGLGIICVIYICNITNKKTSTQIACIVFLAIMVNLKGLSPYEYAFNRVIDTFIGILISLPINKFIIPVKSEEESNI